MAVTQNSYIGNGSTTNYSFTFPYLKASDVKAQLDATVTTAFTLANATTVQFNTAPASGVKIKIYRETDDSALNATFYAGSALKSEDLNDNFTQNLYSTQEVTARYLSNLGGTMVGDMTMAEDVDIIFEGATDDAYETRLTVADPTADRTITLPNVTGTVVTTGDTGSVTSAMIADGTIAAGDIASNAVTTAKVADANVTTVKLAADAVTNAKIADNSIDSEHYVDGSIDTAHLSDTAVSAAKLAGNAVTTAKVVDDAITQAKIAASSIGATELTSNAVTTAKITDDAITQAKIADNSVGNAQMLDNAVDSAELVDNAVTNAKLADNAVGTAEITNSAVTTDKIANGAVTSAKFGDNVITNAKLADDAVNTAEIVDSAVTAAKIASGSVDSTKLTNSTVITAAEQSSASVNDTSFLTSSASDGRYFRQSSAETILDGATWQSSDAYIASTAAIDDRIIDLVDDVGGFVPIANETSFPNANPDVNNGSGTLVSIKALASNLTSNGSGVATIANGTVGNSTVTINGLANSTTYTAGYGLIVETTSTLNTYEFHRQVPKATEITTVAGSISNVNTVAGSISNVNSVAGNATNINTTAGAITNVNNVGGSIANVNTVATNLTSINDFNDRYRVASSAPTSSLNEGDLYYNTTNNLLYRYDGSAWGEAVTSVSGLTTDAELAAWTGTTNITTLGTIATGTWQGTAIATAYIANDAITNAKIANDSIDSEHYVDGSIDTAHIGNDQVTLAKMADDAIGIAQLSATGTASSSTFLRGDNTWQTVTGTTINNNANNRIITGSDTANTLEGEAGLTWDGNQFKTTSGNRLEVISGDRLELVSGNSQRVEVQAASNLQMTAGTQVDIDAGTYINLATTAGYITMDSSQMIKMNSEQATEIQTTLLEIKNQADNETMAKFSQNGACSLYYADTLRFKTTSGGAEVDGELTVDDDLYISQYIKHTGDTDTRMRFQDNVWSVEVAGNERIETNDTRTKFFHNIESTGTATTGPLTASGTSNSSITASGTNSNITLTSSGTNSNINLYSTGSNAQVKLEANNGSSGFLHIGADTGVKLFHGGGFANQKLATTSSGVTVTGTCTATAFSGDGSALTGISAAGTGEKYVNLYGNGSLSNTGCTTVAGYSAGAALASGESENVLIGCECGKALTTGDNNTIIGAKSGETLTTGESNTVVGRDAFKYGTGNNNTIIGANAGDVASFSGTNTMCLGYATDPSAANVSNEITLGNGSIDKFRIPGCNFSLKSTTATDNHVLTVDANGDCGWEAAPAATSVANSSGEVDITASAIVDINAGSSFDIDATTSGTIDTGHALNITAGHALNLDGNSGKWESSGQIDIEPDNAFQVDAGHAITMKSGHAFTHNIGHAWNVSVGNGNTTFTLNDDFIVDTGSSWNNGIIWELGKIDIKDNTDTFNMMYLTSLDSSQYSTVSLGFKANDNRAATYSTVIGGQAGMAMTSNADKNTIVGYKAGKSITDGDNNVCIGNQAAENLETGSNNIVIGYDAAASAVDATNEIILGNSNNDDLRCNDQSISALSDARDKTEVIDLPTGLDFVNSLRPVKFKWETRDGNIKDGRYAAGFLAQDLQTAEEAASSTDYTNLVSTKNLEKLEAKYGNLIPILVQAVKELSEKVTTLESKLNG